LKFGNNKKKKKKKKEQGRKGQKLEAFVTNCVEILLEAEDGKYLYTY